MEIEDHEYERLLHRSRLMDLAQDVLIVLDSAGHILDVNEAAAKLHGTTIEDLLGTAVIELLQPESADVMVETAAAMYLAGEDTTDSMHLTAYRHDGELVHLELRVSFSYSDQKYYVVERNVTEHFERTQKLEELSEILQVQAITDTLTGVPNRAGFDQEMQRIEDEDLEAWLIIMDVDAFKSINDTYGHVVGDTLLQTLAEELQSIAKPDDLIARIGGDEFAIITRDTDELGFQRRLSRIRALVNRTFEVEEGLEIASSSSLGASQREPGETIANWLRRSDRNMYENKAENRRSTAA